MEKFESEEEEEENNEEEDEASSSLEVAAWANYARELEREAAAIRVEEQVTTDTRLTYVEYQHPDPEIQLAKVQQMLARDAAWAEMVSHDDDTHSHPPGAPSPYVRTDAADTRDELACNAIYTMFVLHNRAHSARGKPRPPACTAIQVKRDMLTNPQSAVLYLERQMPFMWVWGVTGPDIDGFFYLHVTTDECVFHRNRIAV